MPAGEKTKALWKDLAFRKKILESRLDSQVTHGMSKTRFYKVWENIQGRCKLKSHYSYKNYGGRGIKCEWNNFNEFLGDMFDSYQEHVRIFGEKETTIERVDPNRNYCKKNCRWATDREQRLNRRVLRSNKSGFRGVYVAGKKWRAQLSVNGKNTHLGLFGSKEAAAKAYKAAKSKLLQEISHSL